MNTETDKLVEFLADHSSRITYHDKWLIVNQDAGDDSLGYTYTVYKKSYGARKTTTLYEGQYLSEALGFLS